MGRNLLPIRPLSLILLTIATAAAGALASRDAPAFYGELQTPAWAPPASVFGPVWTLLYIMMAAAAVLVARSTDQVQRHAALRWYVVQLIANALWSWLFFYLRNGAMAAADVLLLCGLVAVTVRRFWRLQPIAGALLLPYLGWAVFAAALTAVTWRLNPLVL